jgi:hypothetical protein
MKKILLTTAIAAAISTSAFASHHQEAPTGSTCQFSAEKELDVTVNVLSIGGGAINVASVQMQMNKQIQTAGKLASFFKSQAKKQGSSAVISQIKSKDHNLVKVKLGNGNSMYCAVAENNGYQAGTVLCSGNKKTALSWPL